MSFTGNNFDICDISVFKGAGLLLTKPAIQHNGSFAVGVMP